MKLRHWFNITVGLILIALVIWQFRSSQAGLQISHWNVGDLPLTHISPMGIEEMDRPLVLVGHGFAGSRSVMRSFGLSLAHAGYEVILWDFSGHGANPSPLSSERGGLVGNAEAALAAANEIGLGTSGKYAILGHSMGSGVALTFGQNHPETTATIAVSPVGITVTPELPRNLLLMAGSYEAPFLRNAQILLTQAGGPGGDPAAGSGRRFVEVPGVEHITIVFSPTAHQAAREWLDEVFGPQPRAVTYTDRRLLWYGLGIAGTFLLVWGLAPLFRSTKEGTAAFDSHPLWLRFGALMAGALGATFTLWILSKLGLQIRSLLGFQVGGYLLIWFGVAGILSLLIIGRHLKRPSMNAIGQGLLVALALWLGIGLLGHFIWLHWLLIPSRLVMWPLGSALMLPWMLAAGVAASPTKGFGRALWWLAHSAIIVGAMLLAIRLNPEIGFLTLILVIFPLMIGVHALASGTYQRTWAYALSGALFLSWAILAVFPLI